jgi:phosphoglycolate phosphatase
VCLDSTLFEGLGTLLDELERGPRPWGIVTNKPHRLTMRLLERLGLAERSACTVSGDTLPERKPHPAPMFHACELAGLDPETTIYVGDAQRDIEAGLAAGMGTIAAAYGYVTAGDDPETWGAHAVADDPSELAQLLRKAVNL